MQSLLRWTLAASGTLVLLLGIARNPATPGPAAAPVRIERAIAASWRNAQPEWAQRLTQDETQADCTRARSDPDANLAVAIRARAAASIVYPSDGTYLGDWSRGEALAQSGYGLRFTDTDPRRDNGGNCYACHQIDKRELSYGTIGPSLAGYGRDRKYVDAAVKAVYEKIYDPHAAHPCTAMPRFGTNRVLSIAQIKDLVALLMDPESPVNK